MSDNYEFSDLVKKFEIFHSSRITNGLILKTFNFLKNFLANEKCLTTGM